MSASPKCGYRSRTSPDFGSTGSNDFSYARHFMQKSSLISRERGSVAVEFVILLPLFLLILAGIVEFGHLWYVRYAIGNASREGARAGVLYHIDAGRIDWAKTQATDAVNKYLGTYEGGKPKLPGVKVTVPSPLYTAPPPDPVTGLTGITGGTLRVQVSATNVAIVLGYFITAFENMTVTAETTMRME